MTRNKPETYKSSHLLQQKENKQKYREGNEQQEVKEAVKPPKLRIVNKKRKTKNNNCSRRNKSSIRTIEIKGCT